MTGIEEKTVELIQPSTEPAWVCSMRAHYSATGNYRQEDVFRLLGAPWQRVEIQLSADGVAASCVHE